MNLRNPNPLRISLHLTSFFAFLLLHLYVNTTRAQVPVVQPPSDVASPAEIRIIPDAAAVNTPASEFLDSVRYVPLETTKESEIGEISQLIVSDDFFIIMDTKATFSVLLFKKDGRFYKRIKGYNNKPFGSLYEIHFNPFLKRLMVMGRVAGENTGAFEYSDTGDELSHAPLQVFESIHHFLNGNIALSYSGRSSSLALLTAKGKVMGNWLPQNSTNLKEGEVLSNATAFCKDSDTTVFYSRPYDYHVYRFSQTGSLTTPFRFVFPLGISLPADFLDNDAYNNKRSDLLNGKIFQTDFFFQKNNTLAFKLAYTDYSLFAYHTTSGMLYAVEKAEPDSVSFFLPVASPWECASHNNAVYSSISCLDMFQAADKIADKNTWLKSLSPNLRTFFERGGRYDNPVVSVLYLK
ncbi:hypothetical protein HNQ91_003734 [Filimonas zeae]|uniref:6-bladed beta-propeller protein n=1 Tax=Filimonas zeae TaxID=1737353 RepID=A0A917MXK2_9BACT|nr:6-bladed beta-propeller [Filimonas zeae]MDR6340669.1 hypothetical protein [Filimonas zeae]GGH73814.1 hypothetical protein GCM10011379_35750 [Filimonas zeae]